MGGCVVVGGEHAAPVAPDPSLPTLPTIHSLGPASHSRGRGAGERGAPAAGAARAPGAGAQAQGRRGARARWRWCSILGTVLLRNLCWSSCCRPRLSNTSLVLLQGLQKVKWLLYRGRHVQRARPGEGAYKGAGRMHSKSCCGRQATKELQGGNLLCARLGRGGGAC